MSTGYPAVQAKCRDLGIVHDDWQQGLGRLILGKRKNGKYAATVGGVVISIPRQVGKTFTVGTIIFALCLLFPGLTVIWTAHRSRTSNETFRVMQGLAKRSKIRPHVKAVRQANGEQEIAFRNNSRILFGAREQGFGRGFAEVDVEVFDEAQILTERALDDMVAATNQARHPAGALLFYMGTPPKPTDPGDAFTNKRRKALANKEKSGGAPVGDMVYVELSADKDADPDDRKQWALANPSYPKRTPVESMLRLRENLGSDESFTREGLGVWDGTPRGMFDVEQWNAVESETAAAASVTAFAVEVALDRASASIGVAGPAEGGGVHIELIDNRPGTRWVVARCQALNEDHGPVPFIVDSRSPAGTLIDDLTGAGLDVVPVNTSQVARACADLVDAVIDGTLSHGPQPQLSAAIRGAKKRPLGDGEFAFGRKASTADITPLVAVTLAHWAATSHTEDLTPVNNVW